MTKLRILRGDYPGISGWALNGMASVIIRETQRKIIYPGEEDAGIGEMLPQSKEC